MKIKTKFTVSGILMLIMPIALIFLVSVFLLAVFAVMFPFRDIYVDASVSSGNTLAAIGDFFANNPDALVYVFGWALISIVIFAVSVSAVTHSLSMSVQKPIKELRQAADNIKDGNLDFEILGSDYAEFDELCRGFDDMRMELKRSREREKALSEGRVMLIANISHDLKTPITSIKGYIEGIRDGVADTPEKLEKYLDTIYKKAVIIEDMVKNLSDSSQAMVSKLKLCCTECDLNMFLQDVLDEYKPELEKNDMELVCDFAGEPLYVNIDSDRMFRVIANIIDNAIKYKKAGRGYISVTTASEHDGAIISIADKGIGIDSGEIEAVFDEFYRVDYARNSSIKGNGLGLGIARQIINAHGGRIWLKSGGVGKGTTAMIYLKRKDKRI